LTKQIPSQYWRCFMEPPIKISGLTFKKHACITAYNRKIPFKCLTSESFNPVYKIINTETIFISAKTNLPTIKDVR